MTGTESKIFFFETDAGMRNLVGSRARRGVYERRVCVCVCVYGMCVCVVSYIHLTLPTKREMYISVGPPTT